MVGTLRRSGPSGWPGYSGWREWEAVDSERVDGNKERTGDEDEHVFAAVRQQ